MESVLLFREITDKILGCSVAVHRELGPGLPETSYQAAMSIEMAARGIRFSREPELHVSYRGVPIGVHRPDFIVEDSVIVELKACTRFEPVHTKQLMTYLRVSGKKVGLLINFNEASMMHAVKRIVL